MKFHEDVIFKNEGQTYGQELIEIMKIEGKIIEVHQTEYSIIDPKMYKPDLVFKLEDRIIILEFKVPMSMLQIREDSDSTVPYLTTSKTNPKSRLKYMF